MAGSINSAGAQDVLGTSFGIPNSSPGVFWPRGMGIEALSPENLYPDGPNFGLGTTAGGFGTSGTGAMSGVGLTQRSVSPLVRRELRPAYSFEQRLTDIFHIESSSSNSLFASALARRSRREMLAPVSPDYARSQPGNLITPYSLPNVDSILQDRPLGTDAILDSPMR
ncbi:MAG: hypothetical protein K2X27_05530 [Candidatus Obscuribacterales bacterium]|nr:hypothetical protein [Candidatus Obscuribacterales bacterium]